MTGRKYLAAVAQIDTTHGWERSLAAAASFVDQAADAGASLVAFPENFSRYEGGRTPAEPLEHSPTLDCMAGKARERGIWILCGTVFTPAPDGRSLNTSVLLNPAGERVARYDKLHLFDVTLPSGEVRRESKRVCPGGEIVDVDTPLGHLGMSVCYDVRFPELYRTLALRGAQVLLVPAMFSRETGRAHWELLLRARAVENTCYVIAPNQFGGRFGAWGHSMIIDPWGKVLCEIPEGEGLALAEIDLDYLDQVRRDLPCLAHRRAGLY